jgi:hypothetical protein
MAFEQNENRPGHDNVPAAGEIRNQPRIQLKGFTVAIIIALILPASAFLVEGGSVGLSSFWVASAFVVVIGSVAAAVLWRIIASRSNPRPMFRM